MSDIKQPVYFLGHGNPMNAIEDNPYTQMLSGISKTLPEKPDAIMMISAHWMTHGTFVHADEKNKMIYDFSGFPDELYQIVYPAPGSPKHAEEVINLVPDIQKDSKWGLDHGTWTLLRHIFPNADIPVFQLSVDIHQPPRYHYELGQKLKSLREQNILVLASGNIVHNLRAYFNGDSSKGFEWAHEFDEWVKDKLDKRDFESLIEYEKMGTAAKQSVPTKEHYLPMLYCLGMAADKEPVTHIYEEVFSSLSMRSFRIG